MRRTTLRAARCRRPRSRRVENGDGPRGGGACPSSRIEATRHPPLKGERARPGLAGVGKHLGWAAPWRLVDERTALVLPTLSATLLAHLGHEGDRRVQACLLPKETQAVVGAKGGIGSGSGQQLVVTQDRDQRCARALAKPGRPGSGRGQRPRARRSASGRGSPASRIFCWAGLDAIRDAVEGHDLLGGVVERERRVGVAVARLAHRARVDQVAHARLELVAASGRSPVSTVVMASGDRPKITGKWEWPKKQTG